MILRCKFYQQQLGLSASVHKVCSLPARLHDSSIFLKSWGMGVVKASESKEQENQRHSSAKAWSSSVDLNMIAAIFRVSLWLQNRLPPTITSVFANLKAVVSLLTSPTSWAFRFCIWSSSHDRRQALCFVLPLPRHWCLRTRTCFLGTGGKNDLLRASL